MQFFKENQFCRDSVRRIGLQRCDRAIWTAIFFSQDKNIDIWTRNYDTVTYSCIETILKSLFIVFLTLHVTLYFCKAIYVENKWKGKPSLLRVPFVLFKVGEKMQNIRMLTRIYHLSAVLSTALVSSAFTISWCQKKEDWTIIGLLACPSKHSPRI